MGFHPPAKEYPLYFSPSGGDKREGEKFVKMLKSSNVQKLRKTAGSR